MFGIDISILAFIGLVTVAVGALIYFLMFERVSNEVRQEQRVKSISERNDVTRAHTAARIADAAKRKKSVQELLKELEQKQKEKNSRAIGLKKQLQQAGLKINVRQFVIISVFCAILFAVAAKLAGAPFYVAGAAGLVGALGFPRWAVSRLRRRRMNKFLQEFPNAVDVIVRGVKAGLPINDCMTIIAKESREPVAGEFRRVIEAQQMGMPLAEAVLKLYDNMPLAESNFFAIVIAIQQSAGGNLSEALGNLANVLRDRKKMKAKIQAMSAIHRMCLFAQHSIANYISVIFLLEFYCADRCYVIK